MIDLFSFQKAESFQIFFTFFVLTFLHLMTDQFISQGNWYVFVLQQRMNSKLYIFEKKNNLFKNLINLNTAVVFYVFSIIELEKYFIVGD